MITRIDKYSRIAEGLEQGPGIGVIAFWWGGFSCSLVLGLYGAVARTIGIPVMAVVRFVRVRGRDKNFCGLVHGDGSPRLPG